MPLLATRDAALKPRGLTVGRTSRPGDAGAFHEPLWGDTARRTYRQTLSCMASPVSTCSRAQQEGWTGRVNSACACMPPTYLYHLPRPAVNLHLPAPPYRHSCYHSDSPGQLLGETSARARLLRQRRIPRTSAWRTRHPSPRYARTARRPPPYYRIADTRCRLPPRETLASACTLWTLHSRKTPTCVKPLYLRRMPVAYPLLRHYQEPLGGRQTTAGGRCNTAWPTTHTRHARFADICLAHTQPTAHLTSARVLPPHTRTPVGLPRAAFRRATPLTCQPLPIMT